MIYITGDTHGYFTRFTAKRARKAGMELTQEDYIIICGDFGLCWGKEDKTFEYHCKNFEEKPYTILWVQGNNENYDMIGNIRSRVAWREGAAHYPGQGDIAWNGDRSSRLTARPFSPSEGHLPMTFREEFLDRQTVHLARTEAQGRPELSSLPDPSGKAGGPRSCRQRENCRRACAIWDDITTR